MKCPFCGADMDDLQVDKAYSPVLTFVKESTEIEVKQNLYQHIKEFKCCKACGFAAPFFDPKTLN